MKKSHHLVPREGSLNEIGCTNPFDSLPPLTHLDVKLSEVAVGLTASMVSRGLNRTALAEKIGWKKSRLSNVLSGKCNLTLKTINEVTSTLGMDYDIVFREYDAPRPRQVWKSVAESHFIAKTDSLTQPMVVSIQGAKEVAIDLISGHAADFYLSIKLEDRTRGELFEPEGHKEFAGRALLGSSGFLGGDLFKLTINSEDSVYEPSYKNE